jgi:hypothetical protein
MNELALTLALPLAGITGWTAHVVWTRISETRTDAHLRRLLAPRVATFRTDYAHLGGGR